MKVVNILIQSNHNIFILKFLERLDKKSRNLFKIIGTIFPKKKIQTFFSMLTSPHVNKRAQEQFKIKRYKIQLKIKTLEPLKLALMLKRTSSHLFPNINIQITISSNTALKKQPFKCPEKLIERITSPIALKRRLVKVYEDSGTLIKIV
jgi:ribosomal protein S10